ncbi:MAG: hypothetical protein U0Q22_15565 [Acidimicrobiales bacterium]
MSNSPHGPSATRNDRLADADRMWSTWAVGATTDIVPDRFIGEAMPDGTLADRYWWYWPDGTLRDASPDSNLPQRCILRASGVGD